MMARRTSGQITMKRTFCSSRTHVFKGPSQCPAPSESSHPKGSSPGNADPHGYNARTKNFQGKERQWHGSKAGVRLLRSELGCQKTTDKGFSILKENHFQLEILYPVKLSGVHNGGPKTFPDM